MAVELALVDGPYGLPVCLAYLWSEDLPVVFAGGGCHTTPVIAMTRAVTEAAQSRLTAIAGTRDDLASDPAPLDALSFRPARTEGLARGRRRRPGSPRYEEASPTKPGRWRGWSRTSPVMSRWPWTCPTRAIPSTPSR
ncbi:YcaO-like family protein [Streptomyces sp. INA 01156]